MPKRKMPEAKQLKSGNWNTQVFVGLDENGKNPKYTPEEAMQAAERANGRVNSEDNSSDTADSLRQKGSDRRFWQLL